MSMLFSISRKTFVIFVICLIQIDAYSQIPSTTTETDDIEKVYTEEIKILASVFNEKGKFVSNIKKEDLIVMDNGRLHQVASIQKIPANILIVMDTGGQLRLAKSLNQTRKTVEQLISLLQPEDFVAIMQYHDKVEFIAEWETEKNKLVETLKHKANFGKRSSFLQALTITHRFLQNPVLENRHLVIITDGLDTFNNQTQINETMKIFLKTNINVHIISYTKLETEKLKRSSLFSKNLRTINLDKEMSKFYKERLDSVLESEKYLSKFAQDTNGEFILPETYEEMIEKTKLIAEKIASTYIITYEPKKLLQDSSTEELREIKVFSRRSGISVYGNRQLITTRSN